MLSFYLNSAFTLLLGKIYLKRRAILPYKASKTAHKQVAALNLKRIRNV
jgi:hypothetical protein